MNMHDMVITLHFTISVSVTGLINLEELFLDRTSITDIGASSIKGCILLFILFYTIFIHVNR